MKRIAPLLVAIAAVAAVIVPYLALGGASYQPAPVADPCISREWRDPDDLQATLEQVVLFAFDGAACDLGVSREELVLAMRDEESLDAFAAEHEISRADAERALEDGISRALSDAERAGALDGFIGSLLRRALEDVPPWLVLDVLDNLRFLLP